MSTPTIARLIVAVDKRRTKTEAERLKTELEEYLPNIEVTVVTGVNQMLLLPPALEPAPNQKTPSQGAPWV